MIAVKIASESCFKARERVFLIKQCLGMAKVSIALAPLKTLPVAMF